MQPRSVGERDYTRMCPNCTHKLSVHVLTNPLTEVSTGGGNQGERGAEEEEGRRGEEEEEETLAHTGHCTCYKHYILPVTHLLSLRHHIHTQPSHSPSFVLPRYKANPY